MRNSTGLEYSALTRKVVGSNPTASTNLWSAYEIIMRYPGRQFMKIAKNVKLYSLYKQDMKSLESNRYLRLKRKDFRRS